MVILDMVLWVVKIMGGDKAGMTVPRESQLTPEGHPFMLRHLSVGS